MPAEPAIRSVRQLADHFRDQQLTHVDSRQWREDWRPTWVVFADLIAFQARNRLSSDVVLNNIVRFDRASAWARSVSRVDRVYRFSDSSYALCSTLDGALSFATALQHATLAMNIAALERQGSKLFAHTITPRVTIASGQVLWLPEVLPPEPRFLGVDSRTLLAGEGIIAAYRLEKKSAGGLITMSASELRGGIPSVRGNDTSVRRAFVRFLDGLEAEDPSGGFFTRGDVVDIPWLMLRPVQDDAGAVWVADKADFDFAAERHLDVWELAAAEQYSHPGGAQPLETAKHYAVAIRHGIHSIFAARGHTRPSYRSVEAARERLTRR